MNFNHVLATLLIGGPFYFALGYFAGREKQSYYLHLLFALVIMFVFIRFLARMS